MRGSSSGRPRGQSNYSDPQPHSMDEQPFLIFGAPAIGEEEIAEVVDCMRSGWLGTGPRVARFEADFAAYSGSARSTWRRSTPAPPPCT